jgi:cupin 2 domain-containing protein
MTRQGNIYRDVPSHRADEEAVTLAEAAHARIERIVSTGQATPEGKWYDQDRAEFVLLLEGSAVLRFAGESAPRRLERGDYLHIPAHVRHRVEWTDPARPTIWLALHHD